METGEGWAKASVWELAVFRKAYDAALEVHHLAQRFPKHEQYELAKQLRRSSKSICANLAEGRGKQQASHPEFRRYVMIALGSANETLLWCRFARDLDYIDDDTYRRVDATYSQIAKMLSSLAASANT
jgi:four helix bundle protein